MLFEVENRRSFTTSCPMCSEGRSKKGTRSLSVYRDDDLMIRYKCHHPSCEWNTWQAGRDTEERSFSSEKVTALPSVPSSVEVPEDYNGDKLYWYRDLEGNYQFAVRRIEIPSGKIYVPFVYTDEGFATGKGVSWPTQYKGLFGAETIKGKTKAIIVEGEKAALAAQERFPEYAVVTWHGGANNTSKADWSLLHGISSVLLWPDNDDAGKKVMREISSQLPVDKVLLADVSHLPPKFDLADSVSDEEVALAVKKAFDLSVKIPGVFSVEDIEKQLEKQGGHRSTGFDVIDAWTKLPPSGLVVIEGRTKHGKSALAVAMTSNMLLKGLESSIIFYSYEMTASKVFFRYIKSISENSTIENFRESEGYSIVSQWVSLGKLKIVDQSAQTSISEIVLLASRPSMQGSVIVLDYLQIIPTALGRSSRQQVIKEMLDTLRVAAHKNNVLVMVLSQLTPDYTDARNDSPREAKDIHYSADLVLRVWNKSVGESHPSYVNVTGDYIIHTYLNRDGESNVKFEGSLTNGSKLSVKRRIRTEK